MNEQLQNTVISELADRLAVEGVYCRGYGIIPKTVMLDSDLTLEAKSIYAYFCSYSGAGNSAFPGRDKILADLCMSKDSYYKHYNMLLENGYITVEQTKTDGSRYKNNIYTLVNRPLKFLTEASDREYAVIRASGLKSAGYGLVPKAVMTDRRITVKAKGLYAYYASFTGAADSAFPDKTLAVAQLGVGVHTYEKLNRELLQFNFIEIRQRHINGRLGVNDVYLVDRPDIVKGNTKHIIEKYLPVEKTQCSKNRDTEFSGTEIMYFSAQSNKNQDTEKQDTDFQDTKFSDTKSTTTKKYHYEKIPRLINQKEKERLKDYRQKKSELLKLTGNSEGIKTYSARQSKLHDLVICEMLEKETVPREWLADREITKAAVEILTDDIVLGSKKTHASFENGEFHHKLFCLYRDTLTDMLTSATRMNIGGRLISSDEVYEKILDKLIADNYSCELSLGDLYQQVRDAYTAAAVTTDIRNPASYIRACIWNALQSGDLMRETLLIKLEAELDG